MERPSRIGPEVAVILATELLETLRGMYCYDTEEEPEFLKALVQSVEKLDDGFDIALAMHLLGWVMHEDFVIKVAQEALWRRRKQVHAEVLQAWVRDHAPKPSLHVGDSIEDPHNPPISRYNRTRYVRLSNQLQIVSLDHEKAEYVCVRALKSSYDLEVRVPWELQSKYALTDNTLERLINEVETIDGKANGDQGSNESPA